MEGLRAEDPRSTFREHTVLHHGSQAGDGKSVQSQYKMKVTGSYKSASVRLISEAIQIENQVIKQEEASRERGEERLVLNSIKQWFQPKIIRQI